MSSEPETELIVLPSDGPPRRRRWIAVLAALVVLGAAVPATLRWWPTASGRTPAPGPSTSAAVAELVRQDLSTSDTMPGTLGYGTARPMTGGRTGIVTWLAKPGTVVTRGQQLYRVDDRPVPLFYGGMPLYRTISARGTVGRDVRIVVDNLRALGYRIGRQPPPGERVTQAPESETTPQTKGNEATPQTKGNEATPPPTGPKTAGTPVGNAAVRRSAVTAVVRAGDGVLTEALVVALKRWQRDVGLPQTGTIAPGDVVVQAGAVRVDSVGVQPGVHADAALMAVTSTNKVITVLADASEAGGVANGLRVTVALPDGKSTPGHVAAVGTELKTRDGDTAPRLAVTVTLDDPKAAARVDAAQVEVAFPAETRRDVLVAPVGALLALSEGGYAVQVEGGSLVAVKTGMFAKGLVEISGDGLSAGVRVVTAS